MFKGALLLHRMADGGVGGMKGRLGKLTQTERQRGNAREAWQRGLRAVGASYHHAL